MSIGVMTNLFLIEHILSIILNVHYIKDKALLCSVHWSSYSYTDQHHGAICQTSKQPKVKEFIALTVSLKYAFNEEEGHLLT